MTNGAKNRDIDKFKDDILGLEIKREQYEPHSKQYAACTRKIKELEKQIDVLSKS